MKASQKNQLYAVMGFFRYFGKSLKLAFLVILAFLLVLDVLAARDSLRLISSLHKQILPVHNAQNVRINFEAYNAAVKRIRASAAFEPSDLPVNNPFGSQ